MHKVVFLLLLTTNLISGYNVADNQGTLKYLQSNAVTDPPLFNGGPNILPPNVTSSFYGYDFQIRENGQPSLTIGAPKQIDMNLPELQRANPSEVLATGNILACPPVSFTGAEQGSCDSILPPNPTAGDAFGISVKGSDTGSLSTCAPNKQQVCTGVILSPGYCYRSNNNGRTWTPGPRTQALECPRFALDLVFLLDGSGSVGESNFELVKNWTTSVANGFDIASGDTQIGVVQYSHYYPDLPINENTFLVTEIPLGSIRNTAQFDSAVDDIELQGHTTYTAAALNKTVFDFMDSTRYNDPGTSKVLILLTDGRSSDPDDLPASARYVRSLGITTFAVGVGNARLSELQLIATGTNTSERVYFVNDFAGLNAIIGQLRVAILSFALEGSASNSATVTYELEVGEVGFSVAYSAIRNHVRKKVPLTYLHRKVMKNDVTTSRVVFRYNIIKFPLNTELVFLLNENYFARIE